MIFFLGCGLNSKTANQEKTVLVFAGSVSKPPLEEIAKVFAKRTGIKIELNFGGSGTLLSQMMISRKGDVYLPASQDYIDKANRAGIIKLRSEKIVAYLTPAILVQKGNPRRIKSLADLAKPGIKVGIASPDTVVIGLFAQRIIEKVRKRDPELAQNIETNIVTHAKSAEDLASILLLGQIDAAINWSVIRKWHPEKLALVALKSDQIPGRAYIPVAITRFTRERAAAQDFVDFIVSREGKSIFKKYGYIVEGRQQ